MNNIKKRVTELLKRVKDDKITVTEEFKRGELGNARKLLEQQLRGAKSITIIVVQNQPNHNNDNERFIKMNTINKKEFLETTANSMTQLFSSAEFQEKFGAEYDIKYRIGTNDKGMFEYQISLVKVKEANGEKFQ